jgi:hypothetical protein
MADLSPRKEEPHEVLLRLGYGGEFYQDTVARRKRLLPAARAEVEREYPNAAPHLKDAMVRAALDLMVVSDRMKEQRPAARQMRRAA